MRFVRSSAALLLVVVLVHTFARLLFLFWHGDIAWWTSQTLDMSRALWVGCRFDLKVGAVLSLLVYSPVFLIGHIFSFIVDRIIRLTSTLLIAALTILAAINLFFFNFYKTPISAIIFGLAEDDTLSVLKSIWSDFPVVYTLIVVSLLTYLGYRIWMGIASSTSHHNLESTRGYFTWFNLGAGVILLAFLARGTLSTFPLRNQDIVVSRNVLVNYSVPNGAWALFYAWQDRNTSIKNIEHPEEKLKLLGFRSVDEAAKILGLPGGRDEQVADQMYHKNPWPRVGGKLPNVVFALMESWTQYWIEFHSPKLNLLGELEPILKKHLYFTNFFPIHGGTHSTLEGLLLNSPITPLTQGKYAVVNFQTATAKPFQAAGYRTIFVYAGSNAWRGLDKSVKNQGFDELYDQATILEKYPQAKKNDWGVYDEWLFKFVGDLLEEASKDGRPLFIFFLTTTNHPPYAVPPNYHPLPLDIKMVKGKLNGREKEAKKIFSTYQYANRQLAKLIEYIESHNSGRNTLLVATGDHAQRTLFKYHLPEETAAMIKVPALLVLPPPLRGINGAYSDGQKAATKRFGSHLDLFPTLYALVLPAEVSYYTLGRDLFSETGIYTAMTGFNQVYSDLGAIFNLGNQPIIYYEWEKSVSGMLKPFESKVPDALISLGRRELARIALGDWMIRREALGISEGRVRDKNE